MDSIEVRFTFVDCKAGTRKDFLADYRVGISWAIVRVVEAFVVDAEVAGLSTERMKRARATKTLKRAGDCGRQSVECCHCFLSRRIGSLTLHQTRKPWLPLFVFDWT